MPPGGVVQYDHRMESTARGLGRKRESSKLYLARPIRPKILVIQSIRGIVLFIRRDETYLTLKLRPMQILFEERRKKCTLATKKLNGDICRLYPRNRVIFHIMPSSPMPGKPATFTPMPLRPTAAI